MIIREGNKTIIKGLIRIDFKDMDVSKIDLFINSYKLKNCDYLYDFLNMGATYVGVEIIKTFEKKDGYFIEPEFNEINLIAMKLNDDLKIYTNYITPIDINGFLIFDKYNFKCATLYKVSKYNDRFGVINAPKGDFEIEIINEKILNRGYDMLSEEERNFFITYITAHYKENDLDEVLSRVKKDGIDYLSIDDYNYLKTYNR